MRHETGGRARKSRFARRAAVVAGAALALAAGGAPSASAFPSDYCGHGTDYSGWGRVVYQYPYQSGATHYHVYKHQIQFFTWVTVHTVSKVCPYRPHL
jgi:hypothetical protein